MHSGGILLIGLSSDIVAEVIAPLVSAGFEVEIGHASDLPRQPWRVVVASPVIPGLGGVELAAALEHLEPRPRLVLVGAEVDMLMGAAGVSCLATPFEPMELVSIALGRAGVAVPRRVDLAPPVAPLIHTHEAFVELVAGERDELRAGRSPRDGFVVAVRLLELDRFGHRLGGARTGSVWQQFAQLAGLDALADEKLAHGDAGDLLMLLPGITQREAAARLQELSDRAANHPFRVAGQSVHFSTAIGYRALKRSANSPQAIREAREAAKQAALNLDLHPVRWTPAGAAPARTPGPLRRLFSGVYRAHALVFQYLITTLIGLCVPFLVYWWLGTHGMDISGGMYLFVVSALGLTALSIWAEGILALRRVDPPEQPAAPFPRACAIIAAYLPNEAPIIEASIEAFLRVRYPAPLQVILAYNTPGEMPEVEARLQAIADRDPRFVPLRVVASTSKAQNVNAALPYATGEFIAVFDADHQPDPDSFRRAWRWLSHGADIVQGHCFIRNGANSWVAKMVAVEFEQIYAVSHPGRARLHGFGIFGGSNGYWRAPLLRELRMHGFMLTEDIDSSMRAVLHGRRIVSDPYLVSRELAPETLQALSKQRLRWAQGWLQISLKWIRPALRSPHLSLRQKLGMLQLLALREAYPWVSIQIIPLIAWWAVEAGSLRAIDWFVPLFVVTTLFTLSTGPGQIFFTYLLADPQLKKHRSWFGFYVLASTFLYAGLKNAWTRIAHYKEWRGETTWIVTPRVKADK
jgi:cellulose synthase/poly-beta-1,6-N-acetylglucosamine synthase-like glycosyltransferase